jgi:hypothetical protein
MQYSSEIYFARVPVRLSIVAMCSLAVAHTHYLLSFYKHVKSCTSKLITASLKSSKVCESHRRVGDSTVRLRSCFLSTVCVCVCHSVLQLSALLQRRVAVLSLMINTVEVAGSNLSRRTDYPI